MAVTVHRRSEDSPTCGEETSSADLPLRIAAIFVILVGASFGALFPVLASRTRVLGTRIPKRVFDTAKYFGSGVIIATAFIHLLNPAIEELGSPCLSPAWSEYPYALALTLLSIFLIFLVELVAMRWGTVKLSALGITHDPHSPGHAHPPLCLETPQPVGGSAEGVRELPYYSATGGEGEAEGEREGEKEGEKQDGTSVGGASDEVTVVEREKEKEKERGKEKESTHTHHHNHNHTHSHTHDLEAHPPSTSHTQSHTHTHTHTHTPGLPHSTIAASQLVGIAILEFGVLLHSFLIGLTLAVTENFKILFVVLVFHQTFEGLGIGARLASLSLPSSPSSPSSPTHSSSSSSSPSSPSHPHPHHPPLPSTIPLWAALAFGVTTPLGIAIGLGIRETYNPGSATASVVSGVLDAVSAGVLVYTGLVELLAHDFLFNPAMMQDASHAELAYAVGCVMLGCGLMALLGRWA